MIRGDHGVDARPEASHAGRVPPRLVVFVVFHGFQPLDLVGPHEVFHHAGVVSPTRATAARSRRSTPDRCGGPAACRCDDDLGAEVAHAVACELVLHLRRPGSQSQFSVPLWSAQPSSDPIRSAVAAVHADPGAAHGIAQLAAHARLSPRHLQRRFTAELGVPPASYVEQVRIEAARSALVDGDDPVDVIAARCGFGTAETLRRAFHRHLGIPPSEYRTRFRRTPMRETA